MLLEFFLFMIFLLLQFVSFKLENSEGVSLNLISRNLYESSNNK